MLDKKLEKYYFRKGSTFYFSLYFLQSNHPEFMIEKYFILMLHHRKLVIIHHDENSPLFTMAVWPQR